LLLSLIGPLEGFNPYPMQIEIKWWLSYRCSRCSSKIRAGLLWLPHLLFWVRASADAKQQQAQGPQKYDLIQVSV
jgi:DNA-directed RNA polymerase subunit RPC12/RpoP